MAQIDRSEVARALAKAIAYKACGQDQLAEKWAEELVRILECEGILAGGRRAKKAAGMPAHFDQGER